jgi:malate permease and related proteins
MGNVVLLFACMLIGMALRRYGHVPENAPASINGFIIQVSLPALTLLQIHNLEFQAMLAYAVAMPWLLFTIAGLFFWAASKVLRFAPATTGGLILVAGLGNTSFVGLPMLEAFYGVAALPIGILIDQLGSYLVLSTLGILVAALCSSGAASGGEVLRRVYTFPPFIALLVSLLLLPIEYPDWLIGVLRRLGDTLTPLALVPVGLQLRFDDLSGVRVPLSIGIAFKLLVGPTLLLLLYVGFLGAAGKIVQVTLFESAMGPMIGASIVAIQHGLNPPLVTLLVGFGIAASFLTLPVWWYLLQGI